MIILVRKRAKLRKQMSYLQKYFVVIFNKKHFLRKSCRQSFCFSDEAGRLLIGNAPQNRVVFSSLLLVECQDYLMVED